MRKSNKKNGNITRDGQTADSLTTNAWRSLRRYTDARIGLGRAGVSQPTADQLDFQLAHACAQDAVKKPLDWSVLEPALHELDIPILRLHSRVADRHTYLQRPDLGRRLSPESVEALNHWQAQHAGPVDICVVIADGLSAFAVEQQAPPMLKQFIHDLTTTGNHCSVICLVNQGRVAIGDEISHILNAGLIVLLVGERPGLSSPNSLGIYFTYRAQLGHSDAQRNCISNIRPEGLSFTEASQRLVWLIREAQRLNLSGVNLKDESHIDAELENKENEGTVNFLINKQTGKN